jgi:replication factor C small subunit
MNWTEKYRPLTLKDFYIQKHFLKDAFRWIDNNSLMPNILIYGGPGTGKTTAAHALANDILSDSRSNLLEINASQDRRLETIRETVTRFTKTKPLGNVPFKICILDEMDGMTNQSQMALKRTMEKAINVRFILTCNNLHGVDHAVRSRCKIYHFERVSDEEIFQILKIIDNNNNDSPDKWSIEDMEWDGDIRKAVIAAQASDFNLSVSDSIFNECKEIVKWLSEGRRRDSLSKLHELSYKGHSVSELCNSLHQSVLEMEMSNEIRFKILALIGETEWRADNVSPQILLSWFVSKL